MAKILVITPVKDSLENTLKTAEKIADSSVEVQHVIYNDFSTLETKEALTENAKKFGYQIIHLEDHTQNPSPNYKLVLQMAQKEAVRLDLPLVVVESDVEVEKDTLQKMLEFYQTHTKAGLIGAITVGDDGKVNFPYLKFKKIKDPIIHTHRSLSFCCTLFSPEFLKAYNFEMLNDAKDWYDTFISHKATEMGFENFVLMRVPVLHKPHGSRPWKMLKYKNPVKYYWKKILEGKDKI
jgi:GT2 family glycosyltransferase